MRIRRAIGAAATVTAVTAGVLAGFAAPSQAAIPKECATYTQGGWNGDVCVSYIGLGNSLFRTNANVTAFPANCATIRVDLLNAYGVLSRTGVAVPCQTGAIKGAHNCAGAECITPRERAVARINAYDSAGNLILTVQTAVLASPFAPEVP
ncbi:hypothetical protein [Micromonospora sp. NPDC005710]|uniref:hypothetical protein n=1 Tax=Micromonospora sp. NPDC005710 TaxID=3157051 RepID=UPI0033EE1775